MDQGLQAIHTDSPIPPLTLRREAPADAGAKVRRTLWVSFMEGIVTQGFLTWTSGSVLTGYLIHLGAGPRALAAAASIPLLAQVINPFMAWVATLLGRRIAFMVALSLLARGAWLVAALLPVFPIDPETRLTWMMGLLVVSSVTSAGIGPAWTSLMADVVSPDIRGRYFGLRTAVMGLVGMIAALGAGLYLDRTAQPAGFQMVFVVGVLLALVGIRMYGFYYDPGVPRVRLSLVEAMISPLRDANFRRFLVFTSYWQASVMIGAPFVIPYFLTHLQMTYTQIAIWTAIASVCALITGPMWGRLADIVGHKTVLSVTTILAGTVHPLCWMLATPGHLTFIWISGLMDALSWGGIHPSIFNLAIGTAPKRTRMAYIAILGAVNGVCGFTAGLLSGPLVDWLLRHEAVIFGIQWTGYHSLFLISGFFRAQAWIFLRGVYEARAWSFDRVWRQARYLLGETLGRFA